MGHGHRAGVAQFHRLGHLTRLRRKIGDDRIEHRKSRCRNAQTAACRGLDQAVADEIGNLFGREWRPCKRCELLEIDAFGKPQAHEQVFVGSFAVRQRVIDDNTVAITLDAVEPSLRPLLRCRGAAASADVEPTVSPRADAGIFVIAPIDEVVPALRARIA